MTLTEQAHAFAAMLAAGVCLGAVYDLLGVLRSGPVLCAAADLCFGVFCALGMVGTALFLRCEAFRLYTFAAACCGMVLYGVTIGAVYRKIKHAVRKNEEKYKNRQYEAGD